MPEVRNVVEMHQGGMSWPEIADDLGVSIDEAMQRYRDEKYDFWDTGWSFVPADGGLANFESGAIRWSSSGEGVSRVMIEEISDETVPLDISLDDDEARASVLASLTAEQARDLANALIECADIAEGRK